VLSSCALCDAILGDLHEEFVADVDRLGLGPARARYRRRVLGVAAYAVRDLVCWRAWGEIREADASPLGAAHTDLRYVVRGIRQTVRTVAGRADYRLGAVAVLGFGIGVNVSLFTLVQGTLPKALVSGLAAVGLVLLIACAHLASVMLCAGLRRGRERPQA
jgi:hypothetical protein